MSGIEIKVSAKVKAVGRAGIAE
jgi:hypothetical protein